jgi:lipoyl-dependent peroxiredoxin
MGWGDHERQRPSERRQWRICRPSEFPSVVGDPSGTTTPEELLAASHATCYGIGVRSLIGQRGGRAQRVTVDATITAEKSVDGIRVQSSHLSAVVDALEGIDTSQLEDLAREVAEKCTISIALRGAVRITHDIKARRTAG